MEEETKYIIGVKECIENALDLLDSSKILYKAEKYNFAYHFATLALEEIGKSELIMLHQLSPKEGAREWSENQLGDHVKKIFWSFFGTLFGEQKLTKDLLDRTKGLAQHIHDMRLKGLYVDVIDGVISSPNKIDFKVDSEKLINLVDSRINLKVEKGKYSKYENDSVLLPWFLKATDDQDKRNFIMGSKSMEKLAELGDTRKWIEWIKEHYDIADAESKKQIERELSNEILDEELDTPKWKVKFRLYSDSHSIRQKNLNEWNNFNSWVQLTSFSDRKHKNEILVEIISPKRIKIENVFMHSWYVARIFTLALNMGSFGFFWWNIPKYRSKYYESAHDLENKAEIRMEIRPSLKIDWRKDTLSKDEIKNAALCYSQILKLGLDQNEDNPLNYYFGGLTYLGLNDLNYRTESQSFQNFYLCFKNSLRHFNVWDGKSNYYDVFSNTLLEMGVLQKEIDDFYELREDVTTNSKVNSKITLEEVGSIKIVCDAFFIKNFMDVIKNKKV